MGWWLTPELSKKCKRFVIFHWGKDGLAQVKERPVSWVRHEANPHLKALRRKQKDVPLLAVHGTKSRIHVYLSTEKKGGLHA
jgi:hypothetical protein